MVEIKTILFDLDGVVINSEPVHEKSEKLVLERFRIPCPSGIFSRFKGIPDSVFFDYVSNTLDPEKRPPEFFRSNKKRIFEEIVQEVNLIDGFLPFIGKAKSKGIKTALVSSISLGLLNLVDEIYHIKESFNLIITETDTELHKPYPDPYLKALEVLPANANNTIVIEDSPNGIISAKKAGCFVYGLTGTFQRNILKEAGADRIVESYKELAGKLF